MTPERLRHGFDELLLRLERVRAFRAPDVGSDGSEWVLVVIADAIAEADEALCDELRGYELAALKRAADDAEGRP